MKIQASEAVLVDWGPGGIIEVERKFGCLASGVSYFHSRRRQRDGSGSCGRSAAEGSQSHNLRRIEIPHLNMVELGLVSRLFEPTRIPSPFSGKPTGSCPSKSGNADFGLTQTRPVGVFPPKVIRTPMKRGHPPIKSTRGSACSWGNQPAGTAQASASSSADRRAGRRVSAGCS